MKFQWNFGDGYSSSQNNPVHTYSQPGTYNAKLVIADTVNGCIDTVMQQLLINGSPADSCTASFTYTVNPSQSNQLTFTASSNQTIISQTWRIDQWTNPYDSVFLTAATPTYTFTDTGYYQVCLYITTNTGCTRLSCQGIRINNVDGRFAGTIPSYPNPASHTVSLRLNLMQETRIGITVYNLSGHAVYGTQKQGAAGTNNINIPVQQLEPGQYFIDIYYGGKRKRSIFQKM